MLSVMEGEMTILATIFGACDDTTCSCHSVQERMLDTEFTATWDDAADTAIDVSLEMYDGEETAMRSADVDYATSLLLWHTANRF